NNDAPGCSSVTTREHNRSKTSGSQRFCKRDDERRFTCSTHRQIPDADNGMIQPPRRQNSRIVEFCSRPHEQAKQTAHRLAPIGSRTCKTRSVAPVFCCMTASAFCPICSAFSGLERSSETAGAN